MSSRRGIRKPSIAGPSVSSSKGKSVNPQYGYSSGGSGVSNNSLKVDQLVHDLSDFSINSTQDGESKNRDGTGTSKQLGPQSSIPNAWGHPDVMQNLGMTGNSGTGEATSAHTQIVKFLDEVSAVGEDFGRNTVGSPHQCDNNDDDDEFMEDTDDDLFDEDTDSDQGSEKSHDTRKNKYFTSFFESLDKLAFEEIKEPPKPWRCPACRNGPGAFAKYLGLQPLMTHAKTKRARRVKLHQELAELLEEELHRRGSSVIPAGQAYGKWEGLRETVFDYQIVWPPMIVVRNTRLEGDENEKWIGMGNQELLKYFSSYEAVKARHSYGPQGHRGMSVLIFENSAMGYLEADRLHRHLAQQGTGKDAWIKGGQPMRQLYGYMARKEDLDAFNRHCQDDTRLKFEVRSYQEMVVVPTKKMSEDNQMLIWLQNKVSREQKCFKDLQESYLVVCKKLRKVNEENRIVRERMKMQHEQNKEEMDYQEQFFKDQTNIFLKALEDKEKCKKVKKSIADSETEEEAKLGQEEIATFTMIQSKGNNEFEAEKEKMIKIYEDKKAELEKEFEISLIKLMEQYAPCPLEEDTTTSSSK